MVDFALSRSRGASHGAFVGCVAALALLACKAENREVQGNGRAQVETRTVAPFRIVKASTGLRVDIAAGSHGVTVQGEENLVALVETRVEDGTLHVRAQKPLRPGLPLWVRVTAPSVELIAGSSAAKLAHNIPQDSLRIDCTSGAQCDAGGDLRDVRISASSGAIVQAGSALTQSAQVDASSGAKVSVRALVRISGEASSGADVRVVGSPKERTLTASSGAKVTYP